MNFILECVQSVFLVEQSGWSGRCFVRADRGADNFWSAPFSGADSFSGTFLVWENRSEACKKLLLALSETRKIQFVRLSEAK